MNIPDSWSFNRTDVADNFDAHVREQLPWYDLVTSAVVQIGRHYIPRGGHVYDIGASTGNILRALEPVIDARDCSCAAIEPSKEMLSRWDGPPHAALINERAEEHDFAEFDFAVAMLSLMFVAPPILPALLRTITDNINPGGALVVVERTLPPPGYMSVVSSRLTLAAKAQAGAPADEIVAKELSLAGVQRPIDPRLLEAHGAVEWFRFGDFAGYVIEAVA
jgi:tRNA (cmo5U34)-methyltransferase